VPCDAAVENRQVALKISGHQSVSVTPTLVLASSLKVLVIADAAISGCIKHFSYARRLPQLPHQS